MSTCTTSFVCETNNITFLKGCRTLCNHTITLEAAGAAGYAINWIELKGNTAVPETQAETQPQGPTETIHIEAENFASVTGGVNVPAKKYEDSQYITGFAKGDSARYNVTVADSGKTASASGTKRTRKVNTQNVDLRSSGDELIKGSDEFTDGMDSDDLEVI